MKEGRLKVLEENDICILIPTFNNDGTLEGVIRRSFDYAGKNIVVVDDGSTDSTSEILNSLRRQLDIMVLRHSRNMGKGAALKTGFSRAAQLNYKYVLTLDSDGQHDPSHIPDLVDAQIRTPEALIIGSRNMDHSDVPAKRSFGNKFARFWYWVQTGIKLPDTQSGFRLYPTQLIMEINPKRQRFELETELLVKSAWKNIPIIPIPINTTYQGNEGVSHFKPGRDFTRISILNTYYVILALLYYLPKRLFFKKGIVTTIKDEIYKDEPVYMKAAAIGFGLLMSVTPIWGLQSIIGLPVAILCRLNKVLFLLFVNLSIPPLIPVIIYLSFLLGAPFVEGTHVMHGEIGSFSMESIQLNLVQYTYGSMILAVCWGGIGFLFSYLVISRFIKNKKTS